MKKPQDINYNSDRILKVLAELKITDVKGFTDLILECFKLEPETVAQDPAPPAHKLKALGSMLDYLETTERYEDCAFVKKLIDQIKDEL
jgi:hypothetical protein